MGRGSRPELYANPPHQTPLDNTSRGSHTAQRSSLAEPICRKAGQQLVDDALERLQGSLDGVDRAHAESEARPVRSIRRCDPPPIDLSETHVDPESRTGEPQEDHGAGIRNSPCWVDVRLREING